MVLVSELARLADRWAEISQMHYTMDIRHKLGELYNVLAALCDTLRHTPIKRIADAQMPTNTSLAH